MNDFPELENELRALRPARPSPVLFERIEEAMVENCRASAAADAGSMVKWRWRFKEWSRGGASDIDGQPIWARERERRSQTPYNFQTVFPPTIVRTARPFSFQPLKGELREAD